MKRSIVSIKSSNAPSTDCGVLRSVGTAQPRRLVAWGRQQVRVMEPVLLKNLGRYGYEVYQPTPEELAPFKEATKNVADEVAQEIGASGVALLKAIRKAL